MANNNTKDIKDIKKVGRPTAIVPDTVAKLENIFKVGGNIEEACSYAGINKATYYRHLESDEDFATKMEAAQHYADIVAKNVVVNKIVKDNDLDTAKWWLERREFKNVGQSKVLQQFNMGSQDGKNVITFVNFKDLPNGTES